jgi:hypothetical protein
VGCDHSVLAIISASYQRRSTTPSSVKWSSRVGADRLNFGRPRTLLGDGHQHEVCRIQLSKCASRYVPSLWQRTVSKPYKCRGTGPAPAAAARDDAVAPAGRSRSFNCPYRARGRRSDRASMRSLVGAQASRPRRASACGGQVESPICRAELLPAQ